MFFGPINLYSRPLLRRDYMTYRDRTYCSRSYGFGGDCIANCYRLMTVEERKRAEEMEIPIAVSDFKNSPHCALLNDEDDQ